LLLRYVITDRYSGYLLKDFLRVHYRMSGALVRRLKYSENLYINDQASRADSELKAGNTVCVDLYMPDGQRNVSSVRSELDIIYEDEHMICLNKPSGVCTHPVRFYTDCTLANHLVHYYNSKDMFLKIRPVSRLDKNTSGIITFAKNEYVQDVMSKNNIDKEYIAIVHGVFNEKKGIINAPIEKKTSVEREISEKGKPATTMFEVIRESEKFSLLRIIILTGRTHQIRIHLSHTGHPLAGEDLYSGYDDSDIIQRHALHSYKMTCRHPIYKYMLSLSAPIPVDFNKALAHCGLA
jgi:23S rRNA pseudouridine1911/1915/1917 synthase